MRNLIVAIIMFLGFTNWAQKPAVSLTADTNSILIGQQVNLTLTAEVSPSKPCQWPLLPDTISNLVLVDLGKLDTLELNQVLKLQQIITITSFDSGLVVIPKLTLSSGEVSAKTQALNIAVNLPEVSEDEDFYDIKAPLEAPRSIWDCIYWLLLPAIILLVGLVIWWFIKRAENKTHPIKPVPSLPPYELAMSQLHELENEKLWQDGKVKLYYSRLVDVLRIYLEREFAIKTMESTASEVAQKINRFSLTELSEIQNMLATSAMVKYAKQNPLPEENRRALQLVRIFVDKTHVKPKEEKAGV